MDYMTCRIKALHEFLLPGPWPRFVLFGFRPALALHPGRLALNQAEGYAPASKQPACFAITSLNSLSACNAQAGEPFVQYAG